MSAIMTKFRDLDPDLFVGGGHYNDAVLFVNSAKELGFEPGGMLITVGSLQPQARGGVGPRRRRRARTHPVGAVHGLPGSLLRQRRRLRRLLREPLGRAARVPGGQRHRPPRSLALHLAIEAAGSTDTDTVRAALRELSADTFYGPISFDERGVNTSKPMGMIQVLDGDIAVVAPDDAAVAQLEYPLGDGGAVRGGSGSSVLGQLPQALVNGIALGGMYAVLVLGFSVIWGVMGVINFAHRRVRDGGRLPGVAGQRPLGRRSLLVGARSVPRDDGVRVRRPAAAGGPASSTAPIWCRSW